MDIGSENQSLIIDEALCQIWEEVKKFKQFQNKKHLQCEADEVDFKEAELRYSLKTQQWQQATDVRPRSSECGLH